MDIVTHDELARYFDRLTESIDALGTKLAQQSETPRAHLTRDEAAAYLRISVRTLDAWTAEGQLKRAKMGDGSKAPVLFRKVDLDRFVESSLEMDSSDASKHARQL